MKHWEMTIKLSGRDFLALKDIAQEILVRVTKARTFKDFPVMGGLSSNSDQINSYSVTYECPVELRIADLRREADKLERSLGDQTTADEIRPKPMTNHYV